MLPLIAVLAVWATILTSVSYGQTDFASYFGRGVVYDPFEA